jgi:hypothetical protein
MNGNYCVKVGGKADAAREVLKKLMGWKHPNAHGWLSSTYDGVIQKGGEGFKTEWYRSSQPIEFIQFEVGEGQIFCAYSGDKISCANYKEIDTKAFLKGKTLEQSLRAKLVKHRSLAKRMEEVIASLKECNEVLRGHVATNNLTPYSPFTKAFERSRDVLVKYGSAPKTKAAKK